MYYQYASMTQEWPNRLLKFKRWIQNLIVMILFLKCSFNASKFNAFDANFSL